MIRFKTINVDGIEKERSFETVGEILKNWWDEEQGTDLPGGDDEVLELVIEGVSCPAPRCFLDVINGFEAMFWHDYE